jgi:hypothetical protein
METVFYHYYQYDAIFEDGERKEHVSYMLKSSTYFRGKDITECLGFQAQYLATVFKFDKLIVAKLTPRSAGYTATAMKAKGLSIESIPCVEFCD